MPTPQVFLSYCRQDKDAVEQLHDDLVSAGFEVWWDREILGGADWRLEVRRALKDCFAVVACFSRQSQARRQSWMWDELRTAIEVYRCLPPGAAFIFPVRLSECDIPDMFIDPNLNLSQLQYVDLFPDSRRPLGLMDLIESLRRTHTLTEASAPDSMLDALLQSTGGSLWLQFRHAMTRKHGPFYGWPKDLRDELESSSSIPVKLFLAVTHDLEQRHSEAVQICENVLENQPTEAFEHGVHVTLALFLEHLGDFKKEDKVLRKFLSLCDDHKSRDFEYWRARYHLGITSRNRANFWGANAILDEVRKHAPTDSLKLAALHQLGVTDLDLGRYEAAIKRFEECKKRRGDDIWNRRRAYEHRRLGQVFALCNEEERAAQELEDAIEISTRCGDAHYVAKSKRDREAFVSFPKLFQLLTYPDRLPLDPDADLNDCFRVLSRRRKGYLPVFDETTAKPIGEVARWELVHEKGLWHGVVVLLAVNNKAEFAVQRREEKDSHDKWDVAVAGHLEVGETDELAVLREACEELGIGLDSTMLHRLGSSFGFRKEGLPTVEKDERPSATRFVYPTGKTNRELVSVFIAKCDALLAGKRPTWLSCRDAHERATKEPMEYASAFRHLFGTKRMSDRVQRRIEEVLRAQDMPPIVHRTRRKK